VVGGNASPIDSSNFGHKLMMQMGWTGGGLGKDQSGMWHSTVAMYFSGALHPSLFLSFALSMLVMQNRY
jgi:hypothetical protein